MKRVWPILLLTLLLLAACGGNGDSDSEGGDGDTVPPTEVPAGEDATPTREAQVEVTPTTRGRPTLPPTWTPTPSPSATVTLGATVPVATLAVETIPPSCTGFGPDLQASDREFTIGESPTIVWTAVEGAGLYRVFVFDEASQQLFLELTEDTQLSINPDVFTVPGRYGWTVEPLDEVGIQMCFGRGEMLIARERRGG